MMKELTVKELGQEAGGINWDSFGFLDWLDPDFSNPFSPLLL